MSEFIGIKEGWVEKGWTRKEMRDRIEELGLTINENVCLLQPYELNFMQNPDANQDTLKMVEQMSTGGDYKFTKAARNLWTQGESITVSFTGGSTAQHDAAKKYIMQDIQPNVSMKFSFVESGGRIAVSFESMSMGGLSPIGRQGASQWVKFGISSFNDRPGAAFNWARYLTCHEFGHTLGLFHEFDTCSQKMDCSSADPTSVMNYPSKDKSTMDHYSPKDLEWLKKVYKGTGEPPVPTQPKPPPVPTQPKPPPVSTQPKSPPVPTPTQPKSPPVPTPVSTQPKSPPPVPTPVSTQPTTPPKFTIVAIVFIVVFVLILLVLLYVLLSK